MSKQMKWGQRWNINDDGVMVMSDNGSWVENAYYEYLKADNARLKAENELLRYVGDGLAVMVGHIEVTGDAHRMMLELSKEWEDAKEGKRS